MGLVALNGMTFEAPETWVFFPFTDLILGRPDSRAGVMQISSAFRRDVAPSTTHVECARIAREWSGIGDDSMPSVAVSDGVLFGAMSSRLLNEFKRVWFSFRGGDFLVGGFSCAWNQRESGPVIQALAEMEQLMRTARYESER